MKTYGIEKNEDISKILLLNKVKQFNNTFEIVVKDVSKIYHKNNTIDGSDFVMLETYIFPLTLRNDSPVTLCRQIEKLCHVYFVNVKNEEEHFGHLIKNLNKNDRIVVMNGMMCKKNVKFRPVRLTIAIRLENNSSVFLFKSTILYSTILDLPSRRNLSKIIQPGAYELFGLISKIIKYYNEDLMLLRILSHDRSCIKTLRYTYSDSKLNSNLAIEKKFDYLSKLTF